MTRPQISLLTQSPLSHAEIQNEQKLKLDSHLQRMDYDSENMEAPDILECRK